jgi:hypothetical protein
MVAAVKCASQLDLPVPSTWRRMAESIRIPMDEAKGIVLPYDDALGPNRAVRTIGESFFSITHDSVLPLDVIKRTFEYEEGLRLKVPLNAAIPWRERSPGFINPPYALAAAIAGNRAKAAEVFRYSWSNYLLPPYNVCKEYQDSVANGCYLMNLSSLLQTAMLGFTGLRVTEGDWCKYPATLPAGWAKIEIDRIWVRGQPMRLVAESGKKAQLLPTTGTAN